MDKDIKKIIDNAASNVACESGNLSPADLKLIEEQLVGLSKKSDGSFIKEVVDILRDDERGRRTK